MPTRSMYDSPHFCTQQYAMATYSKHVRLISCALVPLQQQYVHGQEIIYTTVSLPHDGEDGENDGQVNVLCQFQEKSCWCRANLFVVP